MSAPPRNADLRKKLLRAVLRAKKDKLTDADIARAWRAGGLSGTSTKDVRDLRRIAEQKKPRPGPGP